jgi:hypothetical protein
MPPSPLIPGARFVVKNGSKMRDMTASAMPTPLSATVIVT